MPIVRSSAGSVSRLIEELSSPEPVRRESAVARLSVLGPRAVTRLLGLATDVAAAPHARISAWQALEAIGDPRALDAALAAVEEAGDVGLAAIAALGALAKSPDRRATRAFDRLAALALQRGAPDAPRLAALAALDGTPAGPLAAIRAALAEDPSPDVAARAAPAGARPTVEAVVDGGIPNDPSAVVVLIREDAEDAPLTSLHRLLEAIRLRERDTASQQSEAAAWRAARGQVHQALAARASRIGLYDLREALEGAAGPLPVGFLTAAAAVGDVTCLEPLAAAWLAASEEDRWWRDHVVDAFRAIVRREGLTRRHPVLKRILERRPAAAVLVALARR